MKKESIALYTFGCRLNQSETAVVERTLEAGGYSLVDFNEPADIVVVNTCTVTANGDNDTRRLVNRINRINPKARIALIGCQAQVQKDRLTALPNVRWVIGNARKLDFLSILKENTNPQTTRVITPTIPREEFTIPAAGIDRKHTRANIKIQDGCDFFCSFCEIPYARGRARSRKFHDIQREAKTLVAAGHKELVITGINVGTYQNNNNNIVDVIDNLEQINGLERIRISSIEPTTVPYRLIKKMEARTKLCRHLHIPLQSGNDDILKKMKRKYSSKQFVDFIQDAYSRVPQICIGTDVIVGFPGETAAQFEDTVEKIRAWPIHYIHVFSYSRRTMAKSRAYPGRVRSGSVTERSRRLRSLSARKRELFLNTLCGTTQKVLFEEKKDGGWTGLTDNYARVSIQSIKSLSNQLFDIQIINREKHSLFGKAF